MGTIWDKIKDEFTDWLGQNTPDNYLSLGFVVMKIVIIIVGARIAYKIGKVLINRFFDKQGKSRFEMDPRKVNTLQTLSQSILRYGIYFIAGMMILGEFVDTTSILATAGIGGLAIGFGAQNLVKDIITGFFILFEDQYAVGDFVTLGDVTGTVEEIGLRITKIRSFKGDLTVIPNGQVSKVVNYTRGNVLAVVDMAVSYGTNIDEAIKVMESVARKYAKENSDIVEEPQVLGVMNLEDSQVSIRLIARTLPMKQWGIERELRKRVKEAFDANGIEIPYPHRVIIQGDKKRAGDVSR
jgi:small-conductance mechanosensitive channel